MDGSHRMCFETVGGLKRGYQVGEDGEVRDACEDSK